MILNILKMIGEKIKNSISKIHLYTSILPMISISKLWEVCSIKIQYIAVNKYLKGAEIPYQKNGKSLTYWTTNYHLLFKVSPALNLVGMELDK